jgi:hypothetical protein
VNDTGKIMTTTPYSSSFQITQELLSETEDLNEK